MNQALAEAARPPAPDPALAGILVDLDQIRATLADLDRTRATLADLDQIRATLLDLDRTRATLVDLDQIRATLADLDRTRTSLNELEHKVTWLHERVDALADTVHRTDTQAELLHRMEALRAVVSAHTFTDPPLVTVVTPTHNRRSLLEQAVASVRAQTYSSWEHLIAVDRCSDDTLDYVTDLAAEEPRVRFLVTDRGRCGAARNDALTMATGSLVVYLDDDNQFDRHWLAAVAWAFEAFPEVQALYGILVIDHPDRTTSRHPAQGQPAMYLRPFDRGALAQNNFVDTGTIAHRAGIPESRFDDELEVLGDWEMFGRLSSVTTPLALPAPSVIYRTVADDRLSYDHPGHPAHDLVRRRLRSALLGDEEAHE